VRRSVQKTPAFILPVVLVLVGLLALVMGGFMFFVRAEVAGVRAERDAQQARLAAESGLQEVITVLRAGRDDRTLWWDNPARFRHALVWSEEYRRVDDPVRKTGSRKDILAGGRSVPAWRFSVVAQNLDGLPDTLRYGITPENGKLNLNDASEEEIEQLFMAVLPLLGVENTPELVAAFLDWRDADDEMRPGGAESDYYSTLKPAYRAKNGKLDTVEELLLVKGFSAAILYGEDTNRNGILDRNEDDGSASFPYYDNGDGILQRGLAPYVTVWSREPSSTGTGGGPTTQPQQTQPTRINVNAASAVVLEAIGIPPDQAANVVTLREEQSAETLQTTDWLVSTGALDAETYAAVQSRLTTRALQFHVEVVGYADHVKLGRRYEWIVEVRGPLVQVLYHRDLTSLGLAWPVDRDEALVQRYQTRTQ